MRRDSLIESLSVPKVEGPVEILPQHVCIWCGRHLQSQWCYTGSVLDGLQYMTRKGTETLPILGTMEVLDKVYILGGQTIETKQNIAFRKRKKGKICSDCAGIYQGITDKNGKFHPYVKTDPLRESGASTIPEREKIRSEYAPTYKSGNIRAGFVELPTERDRSFEQPKQTLQVDKHHWLNVGRRRVRERRIDG